MSKKHKVLLTGLVVGIGGVVAGLGVFAAFSSTTSNPSNSFKAGTVVLTDNDNGNSLFTASAAGDKPGDYERCVTVTYSGSLGSTVKLYTTNLVGQADLGKFNITVEKAAPVTGSMGTNPSCSDYNTAGSSVVHASSTLTAFSAFAGYGSGLTVNPGSATKWVNGDSVSFKVRLTIPNNNASQGATISNFDLNWEAQNQ